jgi:shikimate 5-dehydrogenase
MQKEIVVAGAGWLARPLALALKVNHNHVTVLSRSDEQSAFFPMIMDELLSYSIYWAFISKTFETTFIVWAHCSSLSEQIINVLVK